MTKSTKKMISLDKPVTPFHQAGFVFLIALLFMGMSTLFPMSPNVKTSVAMPWTIAAAMILFFALANSVMALFAKDGQKYWLYSIISYVLLFIALSLVAWWVSGVPMDEAKSIKWVLTVFTFGYLVLLSIVNLIKFIVWLAEKSDANKKKNEGQ
ncbi:MAG: hypothetical protein WAT79_01870 [Saprospiraceae bacterium]